MRYAPLAGFTGAGRATVAIAIVALAQSPIVSAGEAESPAPSVNVSLGAKEIAGALRGKVCTTARGAKFTFTRDGHYAYEGLWKNGGHYVVKDGAIIVILDNGLERSFAISRNGDVFYMERTALSCR